MHKYFNFKKLLCVRPIRPSAAGGPKASFLVLAAIVSSLVGLFPAAVMAQCVDPTGSAGQQVYNVTHKTMQFCDGTNWYSMKGGAVVNDALSDLDCSSGQVAKWNGSAWACAAGGDDLGNHRAAQALNLLGNNIANARIVSATGIQVVGESSNNWKAVSGSASNGYGGYFTGDTGVYGKASTSDGVGGKFYSGYGNGTMALQAVNTANGGTAGYFSSGVSGTALRANGPIVLNGEVNLSSKKIVSLAAPTNTSDAATKGYVDANTSPGGSNKYVQFNDNGTFGGSNGLIYDPATKKLSVSSFADYALYAFSGAGNTRSAIYATSVNARGIEGYSNDKDGVFGRSSSGTGAGVYGYGTSSTNYGIYCYSSNTSGCGGNRAWTNTSDKRLKKDISDLSDEAGLESILSLRPVTFRWRSRSGESEQTEPEYGFLAQEVEGVFPEFVGNAPDAKIVGKNGKETEITSVRSLNYSGFVVPLVKAVQQLKSENDELRARVEKLESR